MISFLLIIGIIGGIENGEPMSNIIWAFLILAIDMALVYRMEGNNGNKNQHKQRRIHYTEVEEGFLTDKNVFLNRTEALIRAVNCGQLSATTRHYKGEKNENELYS